MSAGGGWRGHGAALAAMAVLQLPFSLSSLVLPWGRDQGIYAQAGARLLDGWLPYRDTFVFKPPVTVFVHSLAMALFGREMWAIRALDVGWSLLTGVVLYALAVRATGSRAVGVGVGVAFAWQLHRIGWWASAQTDGWSNLFAGLALLLVLLPRPSWWAAALAGLSCAVLFWFKYTGGAVLPVVLAVPLLRAGRAGLVPSLAAGAGFAAGVGGGLGAMAVAGILEPFWTIQGEVVFPYTGAGGGKGLGRNPPSVFFGRLDKYFEPLILPAIGGAVAVGASLLRRRTLDERVIAGLAAVGWAGAGLVAAYAQGKFFQYQYLLWVGGACLLLGIAAHALWRALPHWRGLLGGVYVLTLGACLAEDPFPERWQTLSRVASGETTLLQQALDADYRTRDMSLRDNVAMGDWLREHTPADRPVFVWAYDPMVYVLADRDMAGRFPYTYPLVVPWAPVERYAAELIDALERDRPSAFVVGSRDAVRLVTGHRRDSRRSLQDVPGLMDHLRTHYRREARVGRYEVWVPR